MSGESVRDVVEEVLAEKADKKGNGRVMQFGFSGGLAGVVLAAFVWMHDENQDSMEKIGERFQTMNDRAVAKLDDVVGELTELRIQVARNSDMQERITKLEERVDKIEGGNDP